MDFKKLSFSQMLQDRKVFGIFDDREKMEAAAAVLRESGLAKTVFATEVTKTGGKHK